MSNVVSRLPDTTATFLPLLIRGLLLLVILILELVGITQHFTFYNAPIFVGNDSWSAWMFANSPSLLMIGSVFSGTFLLSLVPRFSCILRIMGEYSSRYHWWIWLGGHLFAIAAFVFLTALIFDTVPNPTRLSVVWLIGWLALGCTTLILWLLAVGPYSFWLYLTRQEYAGLLLGIFAGLLVWAAIPLTQKELWSPLGEVTLRLTNFFLSFIYSDLIYQPEKFWVIGTPAFRVGFGYTCSGFEGIVLVTIFVTLYLWLFRKELRFPQALWLFPIGIFAIGIANSMRIATLVVIGASFSPAIAQGGFHSHAGWITFTIIALGLVTISHRMRFFMTNLAGSTIDQSRVSLSSALLVPFLVLVAASMVTSAFSSGFEGLYPLRVIAVAVALWYYRKVYSALNWNWSWSATVIGVVVFLLWMALEPNVDSSKTELARGLMELSAWSAGIWLAFRVFGSVIIVPLVEELAFRGYILRKLIARDFENVPFDQFTWLSFIMSSVLFGLLHGRWLAGTLAGMAYALALYRRGQLGDAVLAHTTTNALIAVSVLAQGRWALWS